MSASDGVRECAKVGFLVAASAGIEDAREIGIFA